MKPPMPSLMLLLFVIVKLSHGSSPHLPDDLILRNCEKPDSDVHMEIYPSLQNGRIHTISFRNGAGINIFTAFIDTIAGTYSITPSSWENIHLEYNKTGKIEMSLPLQKGMYQFKVDTSNGDPYEKWFWVTEISGKRLVPEIFINNKKHGSTETGDTTTVDFQENVTITLIPRRGLHAITELTITDLTSGNQNNLSCRLARDCHLQLPPLTAGHQYQLDYSLKYRSQCPGVSGTIRLAVRNTDGLPIPWIILITIVVLLLLPGNIYLVYILIDKRHPCVIRCGNIPPVERHIQRNVENISLGSRDDTTRGTSADYGSDYTPMDNKTKFLESLNVFTDLEKANEFQKPGFLPIVQIQGCETASHEQENATGTVESEKERPNSSLGSLSSRENIENPRVPIHTSTPRKSLRDPDTGSNDDEADYKQRLVTDESVNVSETQSDGDKSTHHLLKKS